MVRSERCIRWYVPGMAVLVLVLLTCAVAGRAHAASGRGSPAYSRAERWVLTQVAGGHPSVDLRHFAAQADRTLSARFLQDLLTGAIRGITVGRQGVNISYAMLRGPIHLQDAVISYPVQLTNCTFQGNVDLSYSTFARQLSLYESTFQQALLLDGAAIGNQFSAKGAHFTDTKAGVSFGAMKVTGIAFIDGAIFHGPVDFTDATIGDQFSAKGTHFTDTKTGVSFNAMKVAGSAFFDGAIFHGPADFTSATIGDQFSAKGAHFTDTQAMVSFYAMKVAGSAFLDGAIFDGPIDMADAMIGNQFNPTSQLYAKGAKFADKADFREIQVVGRIVFDGAAFDGRVDLESAHIGSDLSANGATFSVDADFNGMKVDHNVFLEQDRSNHPVHFGGKVDFTGAAIGNQFIAKGAHFTDKTDGVSFNTMKVTGIAFLDKAMFAGPVDFRVASIGDEFHATDAHFTDKTAWVNFHGMKVAGSTFLDGANFEGPIDMEMAVIGNQLNPTSQLYARGATFSYADFSGMNVADSVWLNHDQPRPPAHFGGPVYFTNATIGDQFIATGAQFTDKIGGANFGGIKVAGIAFLNQAMFAGPVNFTGAAIGNQFIATDAQFTDTQAMVSDDQGYTASFNGMKVAAAIFLDRARFDGPVDMRSAAIGNQLNPTSLLEASGTRFFGGADFTAIQVAGSILFQEATFGGTVNLGDAHIGSDLYATDADFTYGDGTGASTARCKYLGGFHQSRGRLQTAKKRHPDCTGNTATFSNMHVVGDAFFDRARFVTVQFGAATINGQFSAQDAKFTDTTSAADFKSITVGGDVDLTGAMFNHGVRLDSANIGGQCNASSVTMTTAGLLSASGARCHDLYVSAPSPTGTHIRTPAPALSLLDLTTAVVQGQLRLQGLQIGDLQAAGLQVGESATLSSLVISGTMGLTNTVFQTVDFSDIHFSATRAKEPPSRLHVDGMTFQSIQVTPSTTGTAGCPVGTLWYRLLIAPGTSDSPVGRLLCFANQATYTASFYDNLAAFFQREGDSRSADAVVADQKRRERDDVCMGCAKYDFFTYASNMAGWPGNYGHNPERFLYLGAIIVLLGGIVFRKENMENMRKKPGSKRQHGSDPDSEDPHYNSFLYSFGLFVPTLHLKMADFWAPKADDSHEPRAVRLHWRLVRGYKVGHQLLGYLLVTALVADFSGLIR